MQGNEMSLEEFLWRYADDDQIIRVLIYHGDEIEITSAFDVSVLEVLVMNHEFRPLLKHAVKSVRSCGSNREEGHALEIVVWPGWLM